MTDNKDVKYYEDTKVVKAEVVEITPQFAEFMLSCSSGNRNINRKRVSLYADAMKNGEWVENGESIIVSTTGNVIDGQHRLSAVVMAGCTISSLVVTIDRQLGDGLLTAKRIPIDVGYNRTVSDITGISKYDVSIVKMMMRLLEIGGDKKSLDPSIIAERHGTMVEYLRRVPANHVKMYATSPIHSALILSLYMGIDLWDMYSNVLNKNYHKLTPIWSSWMRRVESSYRMPAQTRNVTLFAATWVLASASGFGKVLRVGDPYDAIKEAVPYYESLVGLSIQSDGSNEKERK